VFLAALSNYVNCYYVRKLLRELQVICLWVASYFYKTWK